MAVVYATPPPKQGEFSTGLLDICAEPGGCGLCIYTWFCGPCSFGSMIQNAPAQVTCAGSCCGGCCFQVCLPGWADCIVRGSLRQAYGIQGSACNDCLIGFFCSCVRGCFGAQPDKSTPRGCNTCMMQREITIRKAAAPQMVYAAPGQQVIVQQ